MKAQQDTWPGVQTGNMLGHAAAIFISAVAMLIVVYLFVEDWRSILDMRPVELYISASPPEQGGWQSKNLRVESGRPVNLHVESLAGAHTFALAHTDVRSSIVLGPGDHEMVSFVAPEPGRYVLYCTTWCSPNHWRMRTVLEVTDPHDQNATVSYPHTAARYKFSIADLPLDDPHEASIAPDKPPRAAEGKALWISADPAGTPSALLNEQGWPTLTPEAAYSHLSDGKLPGFEMAQTLSEQQRWALVAYLWRQKTTAEALATGETLYQQTCADCHGTTGEGDGMAAAFSDGIEPDFTKARNAAGASPALYYAKIARGGMGTGMPNWGVILNEDQLWALSGYLFSLMFDYRDSEE